VTRLAVASLLSLLCAVATAQEENASNPLAKVSNTDLRWNYLDLGSAGHINDLYADGAFMPLDSLKLKYELHYWDTNISGTGESGLESVRLKAIFFPKERAWEISPHLAIDFVGLGGNKLYDTGIGAGQRFNY
jgi:hypothetical protein